MSEPIFVVVSGGVVQDAPDFVEVIDFDNLIGDIYTVGDCEAAWNQLSVNAQNYIMTVYPDEYADIQKRMADDRREAKKIEAGQ